MCDEDEVSTMDVRVRMGDAIDPFQLANGVEAVIGDEYQERSNPLSLMLTIQTIHARCDRASDECWTFCGCVAATGLGDECVRCMQWWCCVFGGSDTFDDSSTSTTCLYLSPSQLCLLKTCPCA